MTLLLPDQRETCCYAWHGTGPSHLLGMRPSLRHKAPGSLSQGSNRSGSFLSRFCLSSSRSLGRCLLLGQRSRMNLFSHLIGLCCIKTTEIRTLSLRATATMATLDATLRGWRWQIERKNSLSSPSFRIADHAA